MASQKEIYSVNAEEYQLRMRVSMITQKAARCNEV